MSVKDTAVILLTLTAVSFIFSTNRSFGQTGSSFPTLNFSGPFSSNPTGTSPLPSSGSALSPALPEQPSRIALNQPTDNPPASPVAKPAAPVAAPPASVAPVPAAGTTGSLPNLPAGPPPAPLGSSSRPAPPAAVPSRSGVATAPPAIGVSPTFTSPVPSLPDTPAAVPSISKNNPILKQSNPTATKNNPSVTKSKPNKQNSPVKVSTELAPIPENNVFLAFVKIPDPTKSSIVGRQMTLAKFLEINDSTTSRNQRIQDWWALTEYLALYNVAITHLQDVQICADRARGPLANIAIQLAQNDLKNREIELIEAQYIFCSRYPSFYQSIIRAGIQTDPDKNRAAMSQILPIPTDVPTVAPYNLRAEEISKNRFLSLRARTLINSIPLQFQAVSARIDSSNQAYSGLKTLIQKQGVSEETLFATLERATSAKVKMVHAIIEYNKMIADYVAETVAANVQGIPFYATLNQRYELRQIKTVAVPVRQVGLDTKLYKNGEKADSPVIQTAEAALSEKEIRPMNLADNSSATIQPKRNLSEVIQPVPIKTKTETIQPKRNQPEIIQSVPKKTKKIQPKQNHLEQKQPNSSQPQKTSANSSGKTGNNWTPSLPEPQKLQTETNLAPDLPSTPPVLDSAPQTQIQNLPQHQKKLLNNGQPLIVRGQMPTFSTVPENRIALNQQKSDTVSDAGTTGNNSTELHDNPPLSREMEDQIRNIVAALYKIENRSSGAGDSPIIEMPMSLRAAIANEMNPLTRNKIVESYWRLRTKLAELEIEKTTLNSVNSIYKTLPEKLRSVQGTPDWNALTDLWNAEILQLEAHIAEIKIDVRNLQINLLNQMGRSVENGWPVPSTIPYWGPAYRLETASARNSNFTLLTELVLIPEKLKIIREIGIALGQSETLFLTDTAKINSIESARSSLKILDFKRKNALIFIQIVESLNLSIVRYVSNYSDSIIPNDAFIKSLIGSGN